MNQRNAINAVFLGLLCGLLGVTGCTVSHFEQESTVRKAAHAGGLKSRREVLETLGSPRQIRTTEDQTVYVYGSGEGKGLGLGIRFSMLPILDLSHYHGVRDSVLIRMDSRGSVTEVVTLFAGDRPEFRLWPGGE